MCEYTGLSKVACKMKNDCMSKSLFAGACLGITLVAMGCIPTLIFFPFPAGFAPLPVAAVVPLDSPEADALAKAYQTNPSKAGIYIHRNDRVVAYKVPVLLDNVRVGDNTSKTYIFRQVDPGTHVITSQTENAATLSLDVEASLRGLSPGGRSPGSR